MPKSASASILNHFKRVRNEEETDRESPKRQKLADEISLTANDEGQNDKSPKFVITPPDFNIEYSGIKGRLVKKDPGLDLVIFKPFLSKACAKTLYRYLLWSLPWYKVSLCREHLRWTSGDLQARAFDYHNPQIYNRFRSRRSMPALDKVQTTAKTNSESPSFTQSVGGRTHQNDVQLLSRKLLFKWQGLNILSLRR